MCGEAGLVEKLRIRIREDFSLHLIWSGIRDLALGWEDILGQISRGLLQAPFRSVLKYKASLSLISMPPLF